jgi:glycosyltransferase involved in cell wall biosynthesis
MDNVKITVGTPVYNREDCIGRCIESVLTQTELPFEMLIVDDGSTDATKTVIKQYQQEHSIIKLFAVPKNGGENYARNRCIENASGDFILWLDSDDYILPESIEIIHRAVKENPGFLHYMFVSSDRKDEFSSSDDFSKETHITTYKDWLSEKVYGDFVHLMHKSLFESLPFFEEIRGFPGVNFLRIHRKSQRQLYINKLITIRDRDRSDALSLTAFLDNTKSMKDEYVNMNFLYEIFEEDLINFNPSRYKKRNQKNILIGIAVKEIDKNRQIMSRLKRKGISFFPLNLLNHRLFSPFIFQFIKIFGQLKRKIIKKTNTP